ncbi:hypothetical protein C5167_015895 [Papaver somniferum]|nr:hypothetical protein C5167_015895 [Papaver somniferum]
MAGIVEAILKGVMRETLGSDTEWAESSIDSCEHHCFTVVKIITLVFESTKNEEDAILAASGAACTVVADNATEVSRSSTNASEDEMSSGSTD